MNYHINKSKIFLKPDECGLTLDSLSKMTHLSKKLFKQNVFWENQKITSIHNNSQTIKAFTGRHTNI